MNRRRFLQAVAAFTAAPSIPAIGAAKGYVLEACAHHTHTVRQTFERETTAWVTMPDDWRVRNVRVFNRRLTDVELVEELTR